MEKWRRKASPERGFCGQFAKKTVPPVVTEYHEPKRPFGASNFYCRDCKKQAQTLTVRYAKFSPGLRTPLFRICSPWLLKAAFQEFLARLAPCWLFEVRRERTVDLLR
jgi:hypothetical protein